MQLDKLIVNAEVYIDGNLKSQNIGIRQGKIAFLGMGEPEHKEKIDCKGLSVFPGFIDSQVHFREPGLTHKEDIEYGSRGAAKGGIVAFFEMPNTKPPTVDKKSFEEKINIGLKNSFTDFAFYVGATKENINQLDELRKIRGCCGVKIFMGSSTGNLLLSEDSEIEKVLSKAHCPIAVHSEDEDLLEKRKSEMKLNDVKQHPIWRNEEVAMSSTKRLIGLAKKTNKKVHVLHITTKEEADYLSRFKQYCTLEFTPQHLSLSAPEAYNRLGSFAQMNPPIRDKSHTEALWKALKNNVPDVIGSDHAPHTKEEKANVYPKSPSGMPGVQTLVPVMLTHVLNGKMELEQFVDMTTKNVARVFGLEDLGEIAVGKRASLSFIDMNTERKITDSWMENKSGWTPFSGFTAKAWPIHTMVGGEFSLFNEKLVKNYSCEQVRFKHNRV